MFPLEKRKTPVFTEASRRPGIPNPLVVIFAHHVLIVNEGRRGLSH